MSTNLAEERQRLIEEMVQKLASTDPAERKAAALYLGEAAAGDYIEELVDLYEHDKDRGVRKAAAYALGMFKAVEKEITRNEKSKERVIDLLEQVETYGRLGKRANRGGLYSTVWILLILFGLLISLLIFWQDPERRGGVLLRVGAITVTPDRREEQTYLISGQLARVRADLNTLTAQFQAVQSGGAIDCTAFFNDPPPLPPDVFVTTPELSALAGTLNGVLIDVRSSKARFDSVCAGQSAALTPADVEPYLPTLADALTRLSSASSQFAPFAVLIPTSTPIPTATTDPNVTPSPTPAQPNTLFHLNALYELADSMVRPNGGADILKSYWEDVANTGETDGCRGRVPAIPSAYELPAIDRTATPLLGEATDLINSGLQAVNTGWINFTFACNSQTLRNVAARELNNVNNVLAAFRTAVQSLDQVRDELD